MIEEYMSWKKDWWISKGGEGRRVFDVWIWFELLILKFELPHEIWILSFDT